MRNLFTFLVNVLVFRRDLGREDFNELIADIEGLANLAKMQLKLYRQINGDVHNELNDQFITIRRLIIKTRMLSTRYKRIREGVTWPMGHNDPDRLYDRKANIIDLFRLVRARYFLGRKSRPHSRSGLAKRYRHFTRRAYNWLVGNGAYLQGKAKPDQH